MASTRRPVIGVAAAALLFALTGLLTNRAAADRPPGPGHPATGRAAPGRAAPGRGAAVRGVPRGPAVTWATSSVSPAPAPGAAHPAPTGGVPYDGGGTSSDGGSPSVGCPAGAGAVVARAPGAGRTVALTFDDGPGADTAALLDVLHRRGVRATFFVIGAHAATRPDLVARAAAEGHLIGGHTWHHVYPRQRAGGWTTAYLRGEITRTDDAIAAASGREVCWFRPPGGFLPPTVRPLTGRLGLRVAMWSVDPRDWQLQDTRGTTHRTSAQITDLIVARVATGLSQEHPVILMHDGGGSRAAGVAAVSRIIDLYQAHGYRFVRLDGVGA